MGWELIDHACNRCFGRLLEREDAEATDPEKRWVYRCAECGHSGYGSAHSVCCCRVALGGQHGWECVANPEPSTAMPQEVLVRQRPPAAKAEGERLAPARVEVGGRFPV